MPRPAPVPSLQLPLLAGQSGIWHDLRAGAGSQQYNVGLYTDVRGPLHVPDFQEAARLAVTETEALRVRFVEAEAEHGSGAPPCGAAGQLHSVCLSRVRNC
jgi:hypothetical protein